MQKQNIIIDNFDSKSMIVDSETQEDEDSNIKSDKELKKYLLKIALKSPTLKKQQKNLILSDVKLLSIF